jgi:hypothetical protein
MISRVVVSLAALGVVSCEDMTPAQRNAAIGGGVGATAGALVSGNKATGALVGGALGAGVGWFTGCRQQGGCFVGGRQVQGGRQYDSRARAYYYTDEQTGRTYWENGQPRS